MIVVSALAANSAGVTAQSAPQAQPKKQESVADAARRARAARGQKPVAQPVREFDNDNVPVARVSSGGASPAAAPEGPATSATEQAAPSKEDETARDEASAAVKAEREKLDKLKKELELMDRETKLNKSSFYGRPDYANDRAGAAALAAQDAALEAKKGEIQLTEAKIVELEDKAKSLNDRLGPKPEEPKTPEQQRSAWEEKLRPLRSELASIETEIAQMRAQTGGTPTSYAADRISQLERRRAELQRQIADIEDDARRAGTLPIRN
jgi:hypothetical protein